MARSRVVLKRKPKKYSPPKVLRNLRGEVGPHLGTSIGKRENVTAPWSRQDKPRFRSFFELKGALISFGIKVIAPPAPSASVSVWRLLNDGTDIRHAHMTPGFVRKTAPGKFLSGPGKGGLWYVDPGASLPGIESGRWDELANAEVQDDIEKGIGRAIPRG